MHCTVRIKSVFLTENSAFDEFRMGICANALKHIELLHAATLLSVIHIQNRNFMLHWTVQMRTKRNETNRNATEMRKKKKQCMCLHANSAKKRHMFPSTSLCVCNSCCPFYVNSLLFFSISCYFLLPVICLPAAKWIFVFVWRFALHTIVFFRECDKNVRLLVESVTHCFFYLLFGPLLSIPNIYSFLVFVSFSIHFPFVFFSFSFRLLNSGWLWTLKMFYDWHSRLDALFAIFCICSFELA